MYEYNYFDGYDFTTFNIIETDCERKTITVAVTFIGKISIITYELYEDKNGLYFEYGPFFSKVYIDEFNYMEEN